MKKVFVDTNVLIDLLADRKPFGRFAIELFKKAEKGQVLLFCSSHSIATTYYILRKYVTDKELRKILISLLDFIEVIPVGLDILKKGLRSKHKDFEDSIQIICAAQVPNMHFIVTRNIKDFTLSEIPVLPPDELMNHL